jgi:hypothetical protein
MISTDLLHENNNKYEYVGKYITERKKMDYSYYKNYSVERQLFQDSIIDEYFKNPNIKSHNNPWIIYTCGCYGSGKSHVIRYLDSIDNLKQSEYIYIDPDQIKFKLPESSGYIKFDNINAGTLLHNESVYIAGLIEYYSLSCKYPVIVDGSLQNHIWYKQYFGYIRKKHITYKICIIKVDCDIMLIKERCIKRGQQTGRVISEDLIDDICKKIPESFNILKDCVDFYMQVNNSQTIVINKIRYNNL